MWWPSASPLWDLLQKDSQTQVQQHNRVTVSAFSVQRPPQTCISSQSSVRSFHFHDQVLWFLSRGVPGLFSVRRHCLSSSEPLGGLVTMATTCAEVTYSEARWLWVEPLRVLCLYRYLCLRKQCFQVFKKHK